MPDRFSRWARGICCAIPTRCVDSRVLQRPLLADGYFVLRGGALLARMTNWQGMTICMGT